MAKKDNSVELKIVLNDDAKRAITKGKSWHGSCEISIGNPVKLPIPPTPPTRAESIAAQSSVRKKSTRVADKVQEHFLSDDEKRLKDTWNTSTFISTTAVDESRNNPVTAKQFSVNLRTVRLALERIGMDNLTKLMHKYFDSCERGDHVWQGRNHGFAHLIGFLSRVLRYYKDGANPFWLDDAKEIEDDNPELTLRIADAFAVEFLARDEYGLANPSSDYPKFLKAAKWVTEIMGQGGWPCDEEGLIDNVMTCLRENYGYGGRAVMPGVLKSDGFWGTAFVQFLKTKYD